MIEKYFIRNDLTLRRWRRFKRNRIAMAWCWLLIGFTGLSFTAGFWADSKPLVMKWHGEYYAPLAKDYHPSLFGRDDIMVMDYRSMKFDGDDWALWPLVRWDAYESNKDVEAYPSAPSSSNWMGTDDRGRDVLARLLYGYRYSIAYAFSVWILSYLLGTLIGAINGYLGGKVDLLGSRFVEIIEMMPWLLLLITMIQIFGAGMSLLVILTVIFGWTDIYHQMRSQFLQLRKRDYVEAAKAIGASHGRIVLRHILPNALTPLVTFSPFAIAANISGLALLDYLGLGIAAPTPSWGELMAQAQSHFSTAVWLVWFPSIALLLTMIALISIGLAIRDAFDAGA